MVGGDRQTFRTPQRVHFFDGQLLTAGDFRDEQAYHLEKSRLHNRLFHGSGVVSGLKVGEAGGTTVLVQSGVALDGLGREIMVSEARQIDAAQPTDDQGEPAGARVTEGTVSLLLRYREVGAEPRPESMLRRRRLGRHGRRDLRNVWSQRDAPPSHAVRAITVMMMASAFIPGSTCIVLRGFPGPSGQSVARCEVESAMSLGAAPQGWSTQ